MSHLGSQARTANLGIRLVDPGFAREPGMFGIADRTTGATEKYRAALKSLAINRDAGWDCASGLGAFDHDHTHTNFSSGM
jgi:hypothetical protein